MMYLEGSDMEQQAVEKEKRGVWQPAPMRSLDVILQEAADLNNERRNSRDIIALVRKPLSPEGGGGGDYLSPEVIARIP